MRNALIVLIEILPHFPVLHRLAQMIEKKVERIIEDEKKEDATRLATLAKSYNGLLKTKSFQFIREQDFHDVRKPSDCGMLVDSRWHFVIYLWHSRYPWANLWKQIRKSNLRCLLQTPARVRMVRSALSSITLSSKKLEVYFMLPRNTELGSVDLRHLSKSWMFTEQRDPEVNHEVEKIRIIDLVTEEMKNDKNAWVIFHDLLPVIKVDFVLSSLRREHKLLRSRFLCTKSSIL